MANYTSFLVCFHPEHTDVYINGLSLGIVKPDDKVELGKFNPLKLADNPKFKTVTELRAELNRAIDLIEKELDKNV
jgi:hypothetical protein